MITFNSSAEIRAFLKAKGIDVHKISIQKTSSPFGGRDLYFVTIRAPAGPIVYESTHEGTTVYGAPGSPDVALLATIAALLRGTNAKV